MRIAIVAAAIAYLLSTQFSHSADWYHKPRPRYIESCLDKNTGEIDRYRLCEKFFQENFTKENFPEDTLFLRMRLFDLIPSYEQAAWKAFRLYEILTYGIVFCGFGTLIAGAIFGANANRNIVFSAAAAALLALLTAFGFHAQFKANFIAYRELTTLRDQIEVALVQSAQSGKAIEKANVDAALQRYAEIVNEHAKAFGGSFSAPSVSGGG
ncbi:MAG: hypothetical protein GY873_18945 [Bosea sp.]|uniref:hypothetical protein n=1 Tax=Bosea sp. (in: a-proteobacteria) TaxID=1871050 RepID=UPI00238CC7BD|nr:hypothetical protein [Bosea sp. (in: a-proteobacteria)]MCP4736262.1 hypothetical protein [Bosea sp. (in: a-proteobacteria)]